MRKQLSSGRSGKQLVRRGHNSALILFIFLSVVFTLINPSFLSPFNLYNFLMQNEYRFVMITGLAFIMLGGEIDLSIGYQISLVGVLVGKLFSVGFPVPLCLVAGFVTGLSCGILNGFLIGKMNLSSVIVTLITQKVFQGLSYLISKGMTYSGFPQSILSVSKSRNGIWSPSHLVVLLCIICLSVVFSHTIMGKNILSMGYDEQLLRQNEIPVGRYKFLTYVIGSFFFAVSAILLISRQGLAVSNMGIGLEIDGIFAACIAGASNLILKDLEAKRRIPIFNFYLGMLVIAVIENGMQLSGSIQYLQYIITGAVVLYSVFPTVANIVSKQK